MPKLIKPEECDLESLRLFDAYFAVKNSNNPFNSDYTHIRDILLTMEGCYEFRRPDVYGDCSRYINNKTFIELLFLNGNHYDVVARPVIVDSIQFCYNGITRLITDQSNQLPTQTIQHTLRTNQSLSALMNTQIATEPVDAAKMPRRRQRIQYSDDDIFFTDDDKISQEQIDKCLVVGPNDAKISLRYHHQKTCSEFYEKRSILIDIRNLYSYVSSGLFDDAGSLGVGLIMTKKSCYEV